MADGAPGGVSVTATRFGLQARYPNPLREKSFAFEIAPTADRDSMVYQLQLVTTSGKTWRSHPIVVEPAAKPVKTCVWSALKKRTADVILPATRVPRLVYDFSPAAGDVLRVASGELHFYGLLGGSQALVNRWNRGPDANGPLDQAALLKGNSAADLRPKHEQCADGSWALAFDGVDDYAALPHEVLPAWAGTVTTFEMNPDPSVTNETVTVFGARTHMRAGLYDFLLDKGEIVILDTYVDVAESCDERAFRTGLKLAPGMWHSVKVVNDGRTLSVTADGKTLSAPVVMPGLFMNTTSLGGSANKSTKFFAGKLRNLVIDQALER